MSPQGRRFPFDGTESAYVTFLEARVESLENEVASLQRQESSWLSSQQAMVQPKPIVFIPQHPQQTREQRSAQPTLHREKHNFSIRLDRHISKFLAPITVLNAQSQHERRVSLYTAEQAIKTFRILTRMSASDDSTIIAPRSFMGSRARDILDDYRIFASHLQHGAEQYTRLSKFASMLFLGICCVSRETHVGVDHVDDSIRAYFAKPEYSASYCKRLRSAAKWCAQLMEKLEASVGCRGPELLLLYGPDVASYQKLSESPTCVNEIVRQITKKTEFLHPTQESSVSFFMTFMLAFIGLDLEYVNKALGTVLSANDYNSKVKMVERVTGPSNDWQQSTLTSDISCAPDRLAMLIQAAQSSGHNEHVSWRNTEAGDGLFSTLRRSDMEWTTLVNWEGHTTRVDASLAENSATEAL
ncbi:hypothetical protein F4808DRAFT_472795 [Astrocystis sublimbata]|nr:hypothetical protein F4808DRAFT_472795 [Astrocystis sublimbata]